MKKILFFLLILISTQIIYGQNKNFHYWKQVKTTNCKAYGISPSLQIGSKIVSINFAFTWNKTSCDEITYKNAIKVPKLEKGYHIAPGGNQYYNTGSIVYQVIGNSCGAQTWTSKEFWIMMQNK